MEGAAGLRLNLMRFNINCGGVLGLVVAGVYVGRGGGGGGGGAAGGGGGCDGNYGSLNY